MTSLGRPAQHSLYWMMSNIGSENKSASGALIGLSNILFSALNDGECVVAYICMLIAIVHCWIQV